MWCAGEIVTATVGHVNIMPVVCDDYVFPDDGFLECRAAAFSGCLRRRDEMVRAAYVPPSYPVSGEELRGILRSYLIVFHMGIKSSLSGMDGHMHQEEAGKEEQQPACVHRV